MFAMKIIEIKNIFGLIQFPKKPKYYNLILQGSQLIIFLYYGGSLKVKFERKGRNKWLQQKYFGMETSRNNFVTTTCIH